MRNCLGFILQPTSKIKKENNNDITSLQRKFLQGSFSERINDVRSTIERMGRSGHGPRRGPIVLEPKANNHRAKLRRSGMVLPQTVLYGELSHNQKNDPEWQPDSQKRPSLRKIRLGQVQIFLVLSATSESRIRTVRRNLRRAC